MNIFNQPIEFLEEDKRGGYICPACGSGSGKHGTGMSLNKSVADYEEHPHWKCWSCGLYGDVVNLYAVHFGITDKREAFRSYKKYIGMEHEDSFQKQIEKPSKFPRTSVKPQSYLAYYKQAEENLDPSYLQQRGISKEIQKRFHVGTDLQWVHPKVKNSSVSKRCIIPRTEYSYLARAIDNKDNGIPKQSCGPTGLFNSSALNRQQSIVFITEGEIDAMSIAEVLSETYPEEFEKGRVDVLALCTAAKWRSAVEKMNIHSSTCYILSLDNDETGQMTTKKIKEVMEEDDVLFLEADKLPLLAKDANELLCSDRELFKSWCSNHVERAKELQKKSICLLVDPRTFDQKQVTDLNAAMICYLPVGKEAVDRLLESLPPEIKPIFLNGSDSLNNNDDLINNLLKNKGYECVNVS